MTENSFEIDIVKISKILFREWKLVTFITLFITSISIIIALLSPRIYEAKCVFVPEKIGSNTTLGSMNNLLSIIDVNMNDDMTSMPVQVYPKVLQDFEFQKKLMYSYILVGEKDSVTVLDYCKNTVFFKNRFHSGRDSVKSSSESINEFSEAEYICSLFLNKVLKIEIFTKKPYVSLIVKIDNPIAAASMANKAFSLLHKRVIDFRINNLEIKSKFINEQLSRLKEDYDNKLECLAVLKDKNRVLSSAQAMSIIVNAEREVNLSYDLYAYYYSQSQQLMMNSKSDIPELTVIVEPIVPDKYTSPQFLRVFILSIVFGFLLSSTYVCLLRNSNHRV